MTDGGAVSGLRSRSGGIQRGVCSSALWCTDTEACSNRASCARRTGFSSHAIRFRLLVSFSAKEIIDDGRICGPGGGRVE